MSLASKCSEISAHGVVDPFHECSLNFAREAVKAKAVLDVRQKANHGDSLDASEPTTNAMLASFDIAQD